MSNRYLPTALRRALEKAVKDARIAAEEGARDAIRRLRVADGKAPAYLSDTERQLRRRLRAHARALGDAFDRDADTQETNRLIRDRPDAIPNCDFEKDQASVETQPAK